LSLSGTQRVEALNAKAPRPRQSDLTVRARAAADIAHLHADAVDADARFPTEAFEALKAAGLLGAMVPVHLGGEGASLSDVADLCFILGQACASTAMIFAMHQIKAACLIRHHGGSPWQTAFLRRVATEQLLLASSTTEGSGGGAVRSSAAPVEIADGAIRLIRDATVMSYGAQADAVVTTARRGADAAASDQVLIVFPKDGCRLEPTLAWQTLGMRGTCSLGFAMHAEGKPDQILPVPYAEIHAQTMTPSAHLLWGSVWAGIAAEAVERARRFVRKATRNADGHPPPGAPHLTKATASLRTLCASISAGLAGYEAIQDQPKALTAAGYQTGVMLLKVEASELAVETVMSALRASGLSGYRTDGDASLGRHLRDVLSAPLMINNDRILADVGPAALIDQAPTSLRP